MSSGGNRGTAGCKISRRSLLGRTLAGAGGFWASARPGLQGARIPLADWPEPIPVFDCWIHLGGEYGTFEDYQEEMRRFHIDGGLLVQLGRSVDNQPLLELAARYPQRFAVVGRVPVEADNAVEILRRWQSVSRGALVGIRIDADAASPGKDPLAIWKALEEAGLWAMVDRPQEGLDSPLFQRALRELPGLRLSINHLGRPDTRERSPYPRYSRILRLADRTHALMTMSSLKAWAEPAGDAFPYPTVQPFIEMACRAFGTERMTWGNGYPSDGYARTIPLVVEELPFLDQKDKARILGGTARRVWPSLLG